MNENAPTRLFVSLHPSKNEGARYHIDEMLTTAGIAYSIISEQEERITLAGTAPFVVTRREKRVVFALRVPLDPSTIDEIAGLVTIGTIFGFVIKGEIELGAEGGVINNLGDRAVRPVIGEQV